MLHDVDLTFSRGVVALLGPNGAGKTTLLRCLRTEMMPTSGSIKILGISTAERSSRSLVRRMIGALPQELGYFGEFTLEDFVSYAAWLQCVPREVEASQVENAIARVGLQDRSLTQMRHLSGGQRRRAGIAQAIVHEPRLLVLDEPTNGLDPEQRFLFREMIRELAEDTSVLLATHLVEDVTHTSSRVVVLDGGRVVHDGSLDSLVQLASGGTHAGDTPVERGYIAALRAHGPDAS